MSDGQEHLRGDVVLRGLALAAQTTGMSMGLTLIVHGLVLEGVLVSREDWLAHLRAVAGENGQDAGAVVDGIEQGLWANELDGAPGEPGDDHLHLLQVRLTGAAAADGRAWRIRRSAVSAWSLQSTAT